MSLFVAGMPDFAAVDDGDTSNDDSMTPSSTDMFWTSSESTRSPDVDEDDDLNQIWTLFNSTFDPPSRVGNASNGVVADIVNDFNSSIISYVNLGLYVATFLFGLSGNLLVILVIGRYPDIRRKSVSNYYILNLALADTAFLLVLPLYGFATYAKNWVFGHVACRLAFVLRDTNKFASVFTLMALTVDRYLATFPSFAGCRRINVGVAVCAAIWTVCLFGTSPYLVYCEAATRGGRTRCLFRLLDRGAGVRRVWVYAQLVLGVVVPFVVLVTFNALLLRRVKRLSRRSSLDASARRSQTNANMVRLVLAIIFAFTVCQLPYHLMEVASSIVSERYASRRALPDRYSTQLFIYFNAVAQVLVFVSCCCNPIIYGIFNRNYRKCENVISRWPACSSLAGFVRPVVGRSPSVSGLLTACSKLVRRSLYRLFHGPLTGLLVACSRLACGLLGSATF